jgi:hypothetical protein
MLESILSGIGSIASVISLIFSFRNSTTALRIKIMLMIILCLTVTTSILSYRNYVLSNHEGILRRRTEMASAEAAALLKTFPGVVYEYSSGDNEGIVYGGIAFLEKHKDLFPEAYSVIKANSVDDVKRAKAASSDIEYRSTMQRSAESTYRVLQSIAGPRAENSH